MGKRAARSAGKSPPTRPMMAARPIATPSSFGVTAKAKATWLNVCQFNLAAVKPSKARFIESHRVSALRVSRSWRSGSNCASPYY